MQVLHYHPGEPRTPAVAISLSAISLGFGVDHSRGVTARGGPSTTHPPITTLLITTSSASAGVRARYRTTRAGLRSVHPVRGPCGTRHACQPQPLLSHATSPRASVSHLHAVSARRTLNRSRAQTQVRDAHARPGTYRAPASPAPRRSCGEHVAWHTEVGVLQAAPSTNSRLNSPR